MPNNKQKEKPLTKREFHKLLDKASQPIEKPKFDSKEKQT